MSVIRRCVLIKDGKAHPESPGRDVLLKRGSQDGQKYAVEMKLREARHLGKLFQTQRLVQVILDLENYPLDEFVVVYPRALLHLPLMNTIFWIISIDAVPRIKQLPVEWSMVPELSSQLVIH
jgi:hypothetical protein